MKARTAVLLIAVLVSAIPVASAGVISSVASDVPEFATAWGTQRKLVRAADDTLYAAIVVSDGTDPAVRVFTSGDGEFWHALPRVPATGPAQHPTLAAAAGDGVWLAWTEGAGDAREVRMARYEAGAWLAPERVPGTAGAAELPTLAVPRGPASATAPDALHVAWRGTGETSAWHVHHSVREANGTWRPPTRLHEDPAQAAPPVLAAGPGGAVHAVWSARDGEVFRVWHARHEGRTWGPAHALTEPGVTARNPSVLVDADDGVHVAWDQGTGAGRRVWFLSGPDEHLEEADARPVSYGNEAARTPTLTVDAEGLALIAWTGPQGIRVAEEDRTGAFRVTGLLGVAGSRHASFRAERDHQPEDPAELVFTQPARGTYAARYAREPFAVLGPSPIPGFQLELVVAAVAVALLARSFTGGRAASPHAGRPLPRGP